MSDHFDNVSVPSFILCKANKDRIGTIKCTSKKLIKKFDKYIKNKKKKYKKIRSKQNDILKNVILSNI